MTVLTAPQGYRLWAATYADETAITVLEDRLVRDTIPPLDGMRLLDAGCGTGRRLIDCGAKRAVGVDLSREMLAVGRDAVPGGIEMIVGDVRALPLADRSFDMVWCRLVIGHLPDCAPAYAELARVAAPGALVIVTDFHPQAHAAGHRRTFRADGVVHEVEHYVHDIAEQTAAAAAVGLDLIAVRTAEIGPAVRSYYEAADRVALYEDHVGLSVILGLVFLRHG